MNPQYHIICTNTDSQLSVVLSSGVLFLSIILTRQGLMTILFIQAVSVSPPNFDVPPHLLLKNSKTLLCIPCHNTMEYTQFLVMFTSERGLVWRDISVVKLFFEYCSNVVWTVNLLNFFGYTPYVCSTDCGRFF